MAAALLVVAVTLLGAGLRPAGALPPENGVIRVRTISEAGQDRRADIYLPHAATRARVPAPVVVALHGQASAGHVMARRGRLLEAAERHGFILVLPDGHRRAEAGRGLYWNTAPFRIEADTIPVMDDAAFVTALVHDLKAQGLADPTRIFGLGYSMGGMMIAEMACDDPGLFLGIVVVSGALMEAECAPGPTVSILQIHGFRDLRLPFAGGSTAISPVTWPDVQSRFEARTAQAGCDAPSLSRSDTDAICLSTTCPDGQARLCVIPDGTHAWPGAPDSFRRRADGTVPAASPGLDATETAWTFLSALRPRIQALAP